MTSRSRIDVMSIEGDKYRVTDVAQPEALKYGTMDPGERDRRVRRVQERLVGCGFEPFPELVQTFLDEAGVVDYPENLVSSLVEATHDATAISLRS